MARKDTKERMERPLDMMCYYTNQLSAALVTNTRHQEQEVVLDASPLAEKFIAVNGC